ncbi:hypothetical protein ACE01N_12520 [Saccharicrinis sp. FJH2]|uniref:hypothetical protein n=1 Tax=Saccharicrinis sp. FJH65 TaxID=3344659 RepID=UPI0035F494FF
MSRKIISTIVILSLIMFGRCSMLKINIKELSPVGEYNYHQKGLYSATLKINPDNTFVYEKVEAELHSVCKGNWKIVSDNELLLNCKDTRSYQNAIDSSFFPPFNMMDEKIIFLNKNKIKHNKIILKRIFE